MPCSFTRSPRVLPGLRQCGVAVFAREFGMRLSCFVTRCNSPPFPELAVEVFPEPRALPDSVDYERFAELQEVVVRQSERNGHSSCKFSARCLVVRASKDSREVRVRDVGASSKFADAPTPFLQKTWDLDDERPIRLCRHDFQYRQSIGWSRCPPGQDATAEYRPFAWRPSRGELRSLPLGAAAVEPEASRLGAGEPRAGRRSQSRSRR